ncbi:MAG: hypothetical protein RMJ33_14210 [Saprospiraceae bacterium]|nr:hypothetical protein [Saprospiraceae bacterium]MDW8230984.1 hypothetical protein [Saprospiraceae bacterium]
MFLRTRFRQIIRLPRRMFWALVMEGVETKQMMHTYALLGASYVLPIASRRPTVEQLAQAREQLGDLPRFLPLFVVIIVPAPGVTEGYALLALSLQRWFGLKLRLLPSQLHRIFQKDPHEASEAS